MAQLVLLGGAFGVILVLLAFVLNHFGKAKKFGYVYNGLNFFGAAILAWYAFAKNEPIFIALNAIWTLIALYFIAKKALHKVSPEEALSDLDIEDKGVKIKR